MLTLRIKHLGFVIGLVQGQAFAAEVIDPGRMREITFKDVEPNRNTYVDGLLTIHVNKSASALVYGYPKPRLIRQLVIEWKMIGERQTKGAEFEKSKDGDDFPLRIGLIVEGPRPLVPWFAPGWIKALDSYLIGSTNRMIYGVLGSNQVAGTRWKSPFSDSIDNVAVDAKIGSDLFNSSTWQFSALSVVGYWIMADGDNGKTMFDTVLRLLRLE